VVDAVRWLLGEQSAKSLRGGEMTDVIFNGSSTRKSLGLAEVTMTFANARRELAVDADEVRVTRRVHRDGEGEYLINNQAARLKELRVSVGRAEYRDLTAALGREEAGLAGLRAELAEATAAAEAGEEQLRKLDWEVSRTEDTLRHQEARLADARQQIAAHEAS